MLYLPDLNSYNIKTLERFGNDTDDEFFRGKYRSVIADKILKNGYPMFYLINKFISSFGIMKEAYADVILINMKGKQYFINDMIVDEILKYASIDILMYYGADSNMYEFNIKCKDEFYRRGEEIEDKIEFQRKQNLDKKRFLGLKKER